MTVTEQKERAEQFIKLYQQVTNKDDFIHQCKSVHHLVDTAEEADIAWYVIDKIADNIRSMF